MSLLREKEKHEVVRLNDLPTEQRKWAKLYLIAEHAGDEGDMLEASQKLQEEGVAVMLMAGYKDFTHALVSTDCNEPARLLKTSLPTIFDRKKVV